LGEYHSATEGKGKGSAMISWFYVYSYKHRNWTFSWAKALFVSALTISTPAWSQDVSRLPPALQRIVDEAKQACAEVNNGEFALEWGSVQRIDLNGDLRSDWVLNDVGFACSSAVSLYCGTGGCMSHFLIEDIVATLLNQGWEMTTIGPSRVLVAEVHGSQCDGIGPTQCFVASVWDAEEKIWRSANAEWE